MSVQVGDLRRSEREREGCAEGPFRSHRGTGGRTETGLSPGVSTRRFVAHNSALLIRDIPPNVTHQVANIAEAHGADSEANYSNFDDQCQKRVISNGPGTSPASGC